MKTENWIQVPRGYFKTESEAEQFMMEHYLENGCYRKLDGWYGVYEDVIEKEMDSHV